MVVTGLPALLIMMVFALLWVFPLWRLLPKFGISKWWACIGFVPVIGSLAVLVFIWIMAFNDPVPTIGAETFS